MYKTYVTFLLYHVLKGDIKIEAEKNTPNEIVKQLIPLLGNSENIIHISHCTTRLRFKIIDEEKINQDEIEKIECVNGTFFRSGLFQIMLDSQYVTKIYKAFKK